MTQPLDDLQITDALLKLPGWSYADHKLVKHFRFGDFKEALSFLVRIGLHAEEHGHHPEIHNVYNRVTLAITTHDAGNRVTEKDVRLAAKIERVNWLPPQP